MDFVRTLLSVIGLAVGLASTLHGQTSPHITATPTTAAPIIDGRLDDAVWQKAIPTRAFTQVEPMEGAVPSQETEMRILFDVDTLYIAVRAFDTEPEGIKATTRQRDARRSSDDFIEVALDTFGRGQDGYNFSLTAGGSRRDGLVVSGESSMQKEWDGIWDGAVHLDDAGWSAEFAIPTRTIAFDTSMLAWRLNVQRVIRRKQEIIRWAGSIQSRPFLALPDFGTIKGLEGLQQGLGLTVTPFIRSSYVDTAHTGLKDEFEFEAGLDVVYQMTPSLATTLTINTDFAEAEIDERIVNLTRFPVSLPEKRSFFLQDAAIFSFGGINSTPYPYFSRRIGLSPRGQPIDLLGGLKITGRVGSFSIGALGVAQDAFAEVEQKNLFVGRAAYNWGEGSSAGVLLTEGEPRINGSNRTIGFDYNLVQTVFNAQQRILFNSWVVQSESDRVDATDYAGRLQVLLEGEPWRAFASFEYVGEDYDPGLGFVGRRAYHEYFGFVRHRWRPEVFDLRTIDVFLEAFYVTNLDGEVETWNFELPGASFIFNDASELYLEFGLTREVLFAPFEISNGVIIPTGTYDWPYGEIYYGSSRARWWSIEGYVYAGQFYDGQRIDYELEFALRPFVGLEVEGEIEHRDIRLDGGELSIWIGSFGFNWAFTPDLVLNTLAQYDNVSDELGANVRLRWTFRPGSDLFFVFNQGWDTEADRFEATDSDFTIKGSYAWRF